MSPSLQRLMDSPIKTSLDVSNVIEVYEESGLISHYIYIQTAMTQKLAARIAMHTMNVNPQLSFGYFEIYTTENTNEHFLRYRSAMHVQSVESDLVPVINDLIDMSSSQFVLGIEKLAPWSNSLFAKFIFPPESGNFKISSFTDCHPQHFHYHPPPHQQPI